MVAEWRLRLGFKCSTSAISGGGLVSLMLKVAVGDNEALINVQHRHGAWSVGLWSPQVLTGACLTCEDLSQGS
jgi:hypothetical protein